MVSAKCVSTETKQKLQDEKLNVFSVPLPTGRCMFIKLHQSLTDQRCGCDSYRQKQTVPGIYCDCGHQASYHLYAQCYEDAASERITKQTPTFKKPALPPKQSPTDQIESLKRRLQNLENRYTLESAHWHQRLLQERQAHQETLKQYQQHISTFAQFMNAIQQLDVQRRFGEVEDRLDQVMDCQQRLFDKVVSVEDFGMMLEDRVVDIEGQNDSDVGLGSGRAQSAKDESGRSWL